MERVAGGDQCLIDGLRDKARLSHRLSLMDFWTPNALHAKLIFVAQINLSHCTGLSLSLSLSLPPPLLVFSVPSPCASKIFLIMQRKSLETNQTKEVPQKGDNRTRSGRSALCDMAAESRFAGDGKLIVCCLSLIDSQGLDLLDWNCFWTGVTRYSGRLGSEMV